MSTSMDVDLPPSATATGGDTIASIEIHPLAIVHMSDQYTRVTSGGSPLSCDAPVVGLLFGKMESAKDQQQQQQAQSQSQQQAASEDGKSSNTEGSGVGVGTTLEIRDAEDIPTEISENTAQQISLHQAVFPQHHVVGWYRVAKKNANKNSKDPQGDSKVSSADAAVAVEDTAMTPTEQDLLLTKQLQHHYASKDTTTSGGFIFGLLQVPSDEEIASTAQSSSSSSNSGDQLPLSVYQVKTLPSSSESSASTSFLYALENWQLETSEVERIAVERVVREQPQHHHSSSKAATSASTPAAKAAAAAATDQDDENTSESVISTSSAYATHATSISTSLEAMEQRLDILVEYLQKFNPEREQPRTTKENNEGGGETDVPEEESGQVNLEILREIQGLVYQLGAVEAFSEQQQQQQQQNGGGQEGDSDALLLSHLGAVAKTVCAIQGYTDKFRTLTESRPISGRDMRRFHH